MHPFYKVLVVQQICVDCLFLPYMHAVGQKQETLIPINKLYASDDVCSGVSASIKTLTAAHVIPPVSLKITISDSYTENF